MYAWINWYVPDDRVKHYIFFMVLGLFVFPYLFLGMRFTMFGYLANLLLLDALYYFMQKLIIIGLYLYGISGEEKGHGEYKNGLLEIL